jgi:hypothetical protein
VIAIAVLVLVGVSAADAGAATNLGNGVGTQAALNNPTCDAQRNRLKIPFGGWVPCVKEWKDGADNGGATSPGVTKDSINVILIKLPDAAQRVSIAPIRNRATGDFATMDDAVRDTLPLLEKFYETWGRKVNVTVMESSGADEAAQRADAVAIAAKKPFAVIDTVNLFVTDSELAKQKIIVIGGAAPNRTAIAQAPYRWPISIDSDATAVLGAELVGKTLVGKKAEFAGSPDLQSKTRVFGTVRPDDSTAPDYSAAFAELKKRGGKLALDLTYTPPLDQTQTTSAAQETAPALISKLKDAGVTTVLALSPLPMMIALTNAATAQDYHPEWIMMGVGPDLSVVYRQFDQEQWAHAFGVLGLGPGVVAPSTSVGTVGLFNWYWTANAGVYTTAAVSPLEELFAGIHMAGPKLTPQTFQAGMFSRPAVGGAAEGFVTAAMRAFGPAAKLPYDEYMVGGDVSIVWWDPTAVFPNQTAAGTFRFVDGGKRLLAGQMPTKLPKLFDPNAPGTIISLPTSPPGELPPTYPCEGCPSTGGATPS